MADENTSTDNGAPEPEFVEEQARSSWKDLLTTEDWWAIWLGFALIVAAFVTFLPRPPEGMRETISKANETLAAQSAAAPHRTIAWYKANDAKMKIKATSEGYAKTIMTWMNKPRGWKSNPIEAFVLSADKAKARKDKAEAKLAAAKTKTAAAFSAASVADAAAKTAGYKSDPLNDAAKQTIGEWRSAKNAESVASKKVKSAKPYNGVAYLVGVGAFMAILFGVGMIFMGQSFFRFFIGFAFVFVLAVLAYAFASQGTMKEYGIGYAAWAIAFGLIISNTIGTPKWVKPAVQTEYYIKTGLVLLGCEILFGKILQIGIPGIFVAWAVTPLVLVTTYIFGQKVLKGVSKTFNITVSSAVSVCGVSAAIATATACKAKKEELTLAVGMSLIFTSLMMIFMPQVINATGMDHILGGAWMGGTIDATGAVAAAGAFLGDKALHVSATIKMIQNVLIGLVAFCVAVYWCARVDRKEGGTVTAMEIWYRFPKFVIGFVAASIVMSVLYQSLGTDVAYTMVDNGIIRGFTKNFRGWFFCLAFVSIGLATNFRELKQYFAGGKALILYVFGQSFNLILTLVMAYIMFFVVFKDITAKI